MLGKPNHDAGPYDLRERPREQNDRPVAAFDVVDRFGVVAVAAVVRREWAERLVAHWNAS